MVDWEVGRGWMHDAIAETPAEINILLGKLTASAELTRIKAEQIDKSYRNYDGNTARFVGGRDCVEEESSGVFR